MSIDKILSSTAGYTRNKSETFNLNNPVVDAKNITGNEIENSEPLKGMKNFGAFYDNFGDRLSSEDIQSSVEETNNDDVTAEQPLVMEPIELENYVGEKHLSRQTTALQIAFIMKHRIEELVANPKDLEKFIQLIDAENIGDPPPYDAVAKNALAILYRGVSPVMGWRYGPLETTGEFAGTRPIIGVITNRVWSKKLQKYVSQFSPYQANGEMVNKKRKKEPLKKDSATYQLILSALSDIYTGKVPDLVNRATSYANVAASTDRSWQGGAAVNQEGKLVKGGGHAFFNATNGRYVKGKGRIAEIPQEWSGWTNYMGTLIAQSKDNDSTQTTLAALSPGTLNNNNNTATYASLMQRRETKSSLNVAPQTKISSTKISEEETIKKGNVTYRKLAANELMIKDDAWIFSEAEIEFIPVRKIDNPDTSSR
ncbi:MAG: hypothetical protein V4691_08490 [Pseudomonadota bacterium]